MSTQQKVRTALIHGIVAAFLLLAAVVITAVKRKVPVPSIWFFIIPGYGLVMSWQKWQFFKRADTKIWLWPTMFLIPILVKTILIYGSNIHAVGLWLISLAVIWLPLILAQIAVNWFLHFLHRRVHQES